MINWLKLIICRTITFPLVGISFICRLLQQFFGWLTGQCISGIVLLEYWAYTPEVREQFKEKLAKELKRLAELNK
jgi:hypothetical protein